MSDLIGNLTDKAREGFLRVVSRAKDGAQKVADAATGKEYRNVVGVILTNAAGKYLLLEKPRKQHAWQFPQGGIDDGETLLEAAAREVKEECGDLDIELKPEVVGEYKYRFPSDFTRHKQGIVGARVQFVYGELIDGEVLPDGHEIIGHAWVEYEELPLWMSKKTWNGVRDFA